MVPTDKLGTGDGPALRSEVLISLGEIDQAQIGLHRFNDSVCVYLGNFTTVTGGGECNQAGDLNLTINGFPSVDPPIGGWFAAVGLPTPTSIVVATFTNSHTQWQRPVGRTAFFLTPDGVDIQDLTLLDATGQELDAPWPPGAPTPPDSGGSTVGGSGPTKPTNNPPQPPREQKPTALTSSPPAPDPTW
ncbi:MAG: hypothetical protein GY745_14780 [Actinomycetia bacterium]|nr:hypothetical protein [Actinomycetes bacterium]